MRLRLPARGELLSVFASSVAWDPHALDAGAPLGVLVLRAAPPLAGGAATAPWDERLPVAMHDAGVSVPEEAVLRELLENLMGEWRLTPIGK